MARRPGAGTRGAEPPGRAFAGAAQEVQYHHRLFAIDQGRASGPTRPRYLWGAVYGPRRGSLVYLQSKSTLIS